MNKLKIFAMLLAGSLLAISCKSYRKSMAVTDGEFVLAIHGGVGTYIDTVAAYSVSALNI